MRRSFASLAAAVLFLVATPPAKAVVAEGAALAFALQELDGIINTAVSGVGYEARFTAFSAAQDGHLLIEHFRRAYESSLTKTIDQLSAVERQAYEGLKANITRLGHTLKTGGQGVDAIAADLDAAISRLPLADRQPRVRRFTPTLTSKSVLQDHLFMDVSGNLLDQGEAKLIVGTESLKPITHTAQKLTFAIPLSQIADSEPAKVTYQSFKLLVTKIDCGALCLIGNKVTEVPYQLHVYLLPHNLGTVTISPRVEIRTLVEESIATPSVRVRSNGHTDTRRDCVAYYARDGWSIVTDSIQWKTEHNDHGDFHGIRNATARGFCVDLEARGRGNPWRGRGVITGKVTYKEVRDMPNIQIANAAKLADQEPVQWGKDKAYTLPDNLKDFELVLETYWGERRVLSDRAALGYADLEVNTAAKRVVLKPVAIAGTITP